MKGNAGLKNAVATIALAIMPAVAMAQNAGFRVGIAPQGMFGFPPTQAPAVVTSTFVGVPAVVIPPPPVFVQVPAVIVPQYVLPPGQTFVQQPIPFLQTSVPYVPTGVPFVQTGIPFVPTGIPFVQTPVPYVQTGVPFSAGAFAPTVALGPRPAPRFVPVPGTPRAEVIRQYGAPSVTVITAGGETLYFTGGVTVIIQNGQVIGPR